MKEKKGNADNIAVKNLIDNTTDLIKEFVCDLTNELQNVINGKTTQLTNLIVASCLEDMAKTVRNCGKTEESAIFEFVYDKFFEKQTVTMTVPGSIEEE